LRTPTFSLARGRLFYLVRGGANAYAAVDLHRLVAGPLHGGLVREWETTDGWQWIEHDLTAYAGERAHVEFTPRDPAQEFAVALVVEADRPPAAPPVQSPPTLGQASPATLDDLALAFGAALSSANDALADGAPATSDADQATLAGWMLAHPDLFLGAEDRANVAELAKPFASRRSELAALLACQSHTAPALQEGSGVNEWVLIRGNHQTPGEVAPRRLLEAIAGADQPAIAQGSGRLELARRMTDPANPLLARVLVNRLWHHLFGRGLVESVDNFGVLGQPPTHPELLDHLATELVARGWSIKAILREIALSSAYRMSTRTDAAAEQLDPQNLLLHRANLRRLQGEEIRDALLSVSGRLDAKLYGPSVPTHLTPFMEGRGRPGASGPLDGDGRRSVYLGVRRNFLNPLFLAFDYPIPFTTIGRRTVSNVPAQALALLNDPLVVEQCRLWSLRLLEDQTLTEDGRVERMYLQLFGRRPEDTERTAALEFVASQSRRYGAAPDDPRAWQDLAHVLVNVKEFVFLR
jgi:hypothetical protein